MRLFFIWALGLVMSAQTPADLSAPALRFHADLPRYFRAGPPIEQLLSEARAGAASKGIVWKGLDFVTSDAHRVSGFTATGAEELYRKLACVADSIAAGHITASVSHVSTFGMVYTDYVFAVDNLFWTEERSSAKMPHPSRNSRL